jgi:hypothetical protein
MKEKWIRLIKERMVLVAGSRSTYRFDNKKNGCVVIDYGAPIYKKPLPPAKTSSTQKVSSKKAPPSSEVAKGQKNITMDISSSEFLVVEKYPSNMRCRQFIPWEKIVGVSFDEEAAADPPVSCESR